MESDVGIRRRGRALANDSNGRRSLRPLRENSALSALNLVLNETLPLTSRKIMRTPVHKYFILSAITLLWVCSLGTRSFSQESKDKLIKLEYNAENDVTQISLNPIIIASRKLEELRLGAVAAYKGKVKTRPDSVGLIFLSLSRSDVNKYESAKRLTIVADGQRYPLGETQRSKQTANGLFIETLTIRIPMDDFVRVFRAKEVSLKLGITEVALSPAQIVIFQAFGSYATE